MVLSRIVDLKHAFSAQAGKTSAVENGLKRIWHSLDLLDFLS